MQRKNPTYALIAGIALIAWMASGSYFYASQCCNPVLNESYAGTLLIQDGKQVIVQHNEVMAFAKDEHQLILSEKVSEELIEVVRYVKSNPIKRLTLVGLYMGSETGGAELGKARAEAMRQVFLEAGTPDYQIRTEVGRRDDLPLDATGDVILGGLDFIFDCLAPWKIKDAANRFSLEAEDNFVFDYNSAQFLMPLSETMQQQVKQLADYLVQQPNRQLKITGYNHPEETHFGTLQNLGVARANTIRGLLLEAGAPPTQLLVDGISEERLMVLTSDLYDQFLPSALGFEFSELSNQRVQALQKRVEAIEADFKKRQVYRFKDFGLEENKIIVNKELKTYLQELILYLSNRPKAALYIVGHSNSLSDKAKSALKGRERAHYVRDFLVEQGILPTRISTTTAGDSHPLGRRETQYGQQINRRVDIFVSYDGEEPQLYALPPVSMEEPVPTRKISNKNTQVTTDKNKSSSKEEKEAKQEDDNKGVSVSEPIEPQNTPREVPITPTDTTK